MGGGTGTGAVQVIADLAKERGLPTVAAVIKPFYFEGKQRIQCGEGGLKKLTEVVDAFIVIPNDKLCMNREKGTTLLKSFELANNVLRKVIEAILDKGIYKFRYC